MGESTNNEEWENKGVYMSEIERDPSGSKEDFQL